MTRKQIVWFVGLWLAGFDTGTYCRGFPLSGAFGLLGHDMN